MECTMSGWSGSAGSHADFHRVVLQHTASGPQPRIGFKAKQKLIRGSVARRQLSLDEFTVPAGKQPEARSPTAAYRSFPYLTAPLEYWQQKLKTKQTPQVTSNAQKAKTTLSVWSFPSCAETNLLLKFLRKKGIKGEPTQLAYEIPPATTHTVTPPPPKPVEEPPFALTPILRPDHIHALEVKLRHRRRSRHPLNASWSNSNKTLQ